MISAHDLQAFLHEQIPLTGAMQLDVVERTAQRLVLAAPLPPNVNDKGTFFGGSTAALATLAGWGLLTARCRDEGIVADIVIASSTLDYLKPASGTCTACCALEDDAAWTALLARFAQRGRAKIELGCEVSSAGVLCARFLGQFALLGR